MNVCVFLCINECYTHYYWINYNNYYYYLWEWELVAFRKFSIWVFRECLGCFWPICLCFRTSRSYLDIFSIILPASYNVLPANFLCCMWAQTYLVGHLNFHFWLHTRWKGHILHICNFLFTGSYNYNCYSYTTTVWSLYCIYNGFC